MSSEAEPSETSTNKQLNSVRRACDCCRKRKVKCDGRYPCGPCRKATIRCAYLQLPKKKGPKGLRSAQVLRALRDIDEAAPSLFEHPLSPILPQDGYSQWSLSSASSPRAESAIESGERVPPNPIAYGHGPHPTGLPGLPAYPLPPSNYPPLFPASYAFNGPWEPEVARDANFQIHPLVETAPVLSRIPNGRFHPYAQLFFNHLFPIMPIIDPQIYLDPALYSPSNDMSLEMYTFLCALSAATMVQLDASVPLPTFEPIPGRPMLEAEMFAEEVLRSRRQYDYVHQPTALTVMTSFFIFAYYGNNEGEKSEKAWHYLQEAITFAETLEMDDERVITKLDSVDAQWRRRLFWLLFVTERAYAIQRRKNTRLHVSIELPLVFDSEDSRLLNGFVNLIHLFSAIDDNFVHIWRGVHRRFICPASWLTGVQRSLDTVALALEDITETQHLDISVSREWLHALAWQIGVGNGLVWEKGEGGMRLDYPVELARRVVRITEGATAIALDSHGIGMEQKLSDIAGCLADVLRCSAGDMSDTFAHGRQYLHLLVNKLSLMRGKESRYFKPLMLKVGNILDQGIPQSLTLPPSIDFHDMMAVPLQTAQPPPPSPPPSLLLINGRVVDRDTTVTAAAEAAMAPQSWTRRR